MNNRLKKMMCVETWNLINRILEYPEDYGSDRFCLQYIKDEKWEVYKLKPSLVQVPNKGLEDQEIIFPNDHLFQKDS